MRALQYLNKFHRFSKYELPLFGDTLLFLRWESKHDLRMEFRSHIFAKTKNSLFNNYLEICSAIRPPIMRKDRTGILATALLGVDTENSNFLSGGVQYSSARLAEIINTIKTPEAMRMVLFGGELTYFLATIENLWVYLYLSASMGMTSSDIVDDLNFILESDFEGITKWRLKAEPTPDLIHYFLEEHKLALGSTKSD